MILEAFGNRVKELRSSQLISQLELADKTGIDRAQISRIELGKINVTLETIDKLSRALRVPMSDLLLIDTTSYLKPFVKWAGGKGQIINKLKQYMPDTYNTYFEPFVGGGALLFSLAPTKAVINDNNRDLICAYRCFKTLPLFASLLEQLFEHECNHSEEYYYQIRDMDRDEEYVNLPMHIRAARLIYLNKACFNGLYRVNSKGYFNVPSGHKERIKVYDRKNMEDLYDYFTGYDIKILNKDFVEACETAKKGDFVYFDPPYDTFDDKDSFTSYSKESFGKEEQKKLANLFMKLSARGVKVMLSNHNTKFINDLYSGFNIHVIEAKRMINSKADGRGNVEEVIITNY